MASLVFVRRRNFMTFQKWVDLQGTAGSKFCRRFVLAVSLLLLFFVGSDIFVQQIVCRRDPPIKSQVIPAGQLRPYTSCPRILAFLQKWWNPLFVAEENFVKWGMNCTTSGRATINFSEWAKEREIAVMKSSLRLNKGAPYHVIKEDSPSRSPACWSLLHTCSILAPSMCLPYNFSVRSYVFIVIV